MMKRLKVTRFRQININNLKLENLFINDAFGTAHHAHSSIVDVKLEEIASGYLLKK